MSNETLSVTHSDRDNAPPARTCEDQLRDFVECVFDSSDIIEIRRLRSGRSTWHPASELTSLADELTRENLTQDIYGGVNSRACSGDGRSAAKCSGQQCRKCSACILLARVLFVDFDKTTLDEARFKIKDAGLPAPTAIVASGGGVHAYWRLDEAVTDMSLWTAMQRGLAALLGSDPAVHDTPRIMRLPGFLNRKYDPPRTCEIIEAAPERVYAIAEFEELAAPGGPEPNKLTKPSNDSGEARIPEGTRNDALFRLACGLRSRDLSAEAIAAALLAHNRERCDPPLPDLEVRQLAKNASQYPVGVGLNSLNAVISHYATEKNVPSEGVAWPAPADGAAFYGLAGEFVSLVGPHTEADPVALLLGFLVGFGNLIGRQSHFVVERTQHFLNLFAVLVGQSSKSRKGTSWDQTRRALQNADSDWAASRIRSGLSSGEGLIWQVRDEIIRRVYDKKAKESIDVVDDPGIDDKRLLIVEPEFASVLRVMERDGNTLSAIIREAWDRGDLHTLTKNSPANATGAHVSIIGHVTAEEVTRYLRRTEKGNGFGNRFLWACVKRSKVLPEGGNLDSVDFADFNDRLKAARDFGAEARCLRRDDTARDVWRAVYEELSEGKPGMVGALTSRSEAQVMRIAAIHALLDLSDLIREEHLLAALALWEYCEASVGFVFGNTLGDPVADEIAEVLSATPAGLTRTQISNLMGRHQDKSRLAASLALLVKHGRAHSITEETGGRPAERWVSGGVGRKKN